MSFPLLLAGGAALFLLSGKKKKKKTGTVVLADEYAEEESVEADEEEVDAGAGPEPEGEGDEDPGYGTVASGVRKDRLGPHPWRVRFEEDGYHAQIMVYAGRFSPISYEVGIAATLSAAKKLLSDEFNDLLLAKYPNEQPKLDPMTLLTATASDESGGGVGGFQS